MAPLPKATSRCDHWLLLSFLLLLALGIIMVFSSSQYFAQYAPYNDAYYFLKSQLKNAFVGLIVMIFAYKIPYQAYYKFSMPFFAVIAALLVFMAVSTQIETIGGAQRWLEIAGFSFQPSELTKIAMPMMLATFCTRRLSKMSSLKDGFIPGMLIIALVAGLIYAQTDLSSAVVVAVSGVIILFCAGIKFSYLLTTGLAGVAAVGVAIFSNEFRMDRVMAWLDPWNPQYVADQSWQTVQSLMAIGSGGLTGVGLGDGGSKWFYLPERHTDFIFSVYCEETGFLGALIMLGLIAFVVWRGILVAVKAPDTFSSLMCIGMISCIGVQSIVNLFVCTGLFPVTGVTLPFVSYGGTSLVVSMAMMGILLNISRASKC